MLERYQYLYKKAVLRIRSNFNRIRRFTDPALQSGSKFLKKKTDPDPT